MLLRKEIGQKTNGQYFEINDSGNMWQRWLYMNKIEGENRDARLVDVSANRYFYF